jgi:hypothetical protein
MHIHNDGSCKHDLKVCADCGNVYCSKCSKEWFKDRNVSYSYIPYTATNTYPTVTWQAETGTHVHTQ